MSKLDTNKNGKVDRWETAKARVAHRKAQAKYQKSEEQVQKRVNRNKARRTALREGRVHKGDNKDVGHRDGNALNNDPTNWAVQSRRSNRSYPRDKKAHKQNPTD